MNTLDERSSYKAGVRDMSEIQDQDSYVAETKYEIVGIPEQYEEKWAQGNKNGDIITINETRSHDMHDFQKHTKSQFVLLYGDGLSWIPPEWVRPVGRDWTKPSSYKTGMQLRLKGIPEKRLKQVWNGKYKNGDIITLADPPTTESYLHETKFDFQLRFGEYNLLPVEWVEPVPVSTTGPDRAQFKAGDKRPVGREEGPTAPEPSAPASFARIGGGSLRDPEEIAPAREGAKLPRSAFKAGAKHRIINLFVKESFTAPYGTNRAVAKVGDIITLADPPTGDISPGSGISSTSSFFVRYIHSATEVTWILPECLDPTPCEDGLAEPRPREFYTPGMKCRTINIPETWMSSPAGASRNDLRVGDILTLGNPPTEDLTKITPHLVRWRTEEDFALRYEFLAGGHCTYIAAELVEPISSRPALERSSLREGMKFRVVGLPDFINYFAKPLERETSGHLRNGDIITIHKELTKTPYSMVALKKSKYDFFLSYNYSDDHEYGAGIPPDWVESVDSEEVVPAKPGDSVPTGPDLGSRSDPPPMRPQGAGAEGPEDTYKVGDQYRITSLPKEWEIIARKVGDTIILSDPPTMAANSYYIKKETKYEFVLLYNNSTKWIPLECVEPIPTVPIQTPQEIARNMPPKVTTDFRAGDRLRIVNLPKDVIHPSPYEPMNLENGHIVTIADPPRFQGHLRIKRHDSTNIRRILVKPEYVEKLPPLLRKCECSQDTLYNTRGACVCGAEGPAITKESLACGQKFRAVGIPADKNGKWYGGRIVNGTIIELRDPPFTDTGDYLKDLYGTKSDFLLHTKLGWAIPPEWVERLSPLETKITRDAFSED